MMLGWFLSRSTMAWTAFKSGKVLALNRRYVTSAASIDPFISDKNNHTLIPSSFSPKEGGGGTNAKHSASECWTMFHFRASRDRVVVVLFNLMHIYFGDRDRTASRREKRQ